MIPWNMIEFMRRAQLSSTATHSEPKERKRAKGNATRPEQEDAVADLHLRQQTSVYLVLLSDGSKNPEKAKLYSHHLILVCGVEDEETLSGFRFHLHATTSLKTWYPPYLNLVNFLRFPAPFVNVSIQKSDVLGWYLLNKSNLSLIEISQKADSIFVREADRTWRPQWHSQVFAHRLVTAMGLSYPEDVAVMIDECPSTTCQVECTPETSFAEGCVIL